MEPGGEKKSQVKPGDLEAPPCKFLYYAVLEEVTGGCDFLLSLKLDPSNWRLLAPSLMLGMYVLPSVPTARAIFKDAVLREQGVIETIWMVYLTEPH